VVYVRSILSIFLISISYIGEHQFLSPTCGGMPCHQQMGWTFIWIPIMIHVWTSYKLRFVLHDLCISTCVCWVVPIYCQMLIGLSFDFRVGGLLRCVPFGYDMKVNTCFQMDLLVIYVYYSMWNFKWKSLHLPMCAFNITMNPKAVISVVNGQTWEMAITQS
jgi:hypothetical protein